MGLAQKKPWWALVACLLVAVSVTWGGLQLSTRDRIKDLKADIVAKDKQIEALTLSNRLKDSTFIAEVSRIQQQSKKEITDFMAGVIENEQGRNRRLERLEQQRQGLYRKNAEIIRKNQSIISNPDAQK